MRLGDFFRLSKYSRGERVLVHDGPGGPLVWATLLDLDKGPDEHRIEVWLMEYDNRPGITQKRAIPCQCDRCRQEWK